MTTIASLQAVVAAAFGISREALLSRCRKQDIAFPRQVAMHLSVKMLEKGYSETGRAFDRHHTTVMHGCRIIEKMAEDETFKQHLDAVKEMVWLSLQMTTQPKETVQCPTSEQPASSPMGS